MTFIRQNMLKLTVLLLATVITTACAPSQSQQDAPHTGGIELEGQYGTLSVEQVKPGIQVFVFADRVNVRTSPEVKSDNLAGTLDMNDKVEIVNAQILGPDKFLAIRVIESQSQLPKDKVLYVSMKYLDLNPRKLEPQDERASKIFIVTNIATEKVRVYLRCEPNEGCVNKMIFEQDVVNGEDSSGTRSDVGHYRISQWEKFYETEGKYPAWYKEGYPALPPPGSSMSSWFSKKVMPGGQGDMRGAFGWYTMKVNPNPNGQWMHGTAGWGADKKSFIDFKTGFWASIVNLFASIRSHGCTRIDNESIAYLRSIMPVGATYVKIYAKEGSRQQVPTAWLPKKASWDYVLTKNGGGVVNNHELAARDVVLANGTPRSQWIEEGALIVNQYPKPIAFNPQERNSAGGNLYGIRQSQFRGVFLVDEGTLVGYQHPSDLDVGGFSDRNMPSYMISTDQRYYVPPAPVEESPLNFNR